MKNVNPKSVHGFTLVELMIVIAIIGTLAAIVIPKFSNMIAKSNEGATRGNLGSIRSALSIYYADMEGLYPSDGTGPTQHGNKHRACTTCTTNLDSLLADSKYLSDIPDAILPLTPNSTGHDTADIIDTLSLDPSGNYLLTDLGGWAYQWDPTKPSWGVIVVNCSHQDVKGQDWFSY